MRRISCDQYEFEPHDSEQSLELAMASPSKHTPDLASFLIACGTSQRASLPLPNGWPRWNMVTTHLSQFAGITLPPMTTVREAVLLSDDWNDVELGIAFDSVFVWYHWTTSA